MGGCYEYKINKIFSSYQEAFNQLQELLKISKSYDIYKFRIQLGRLLQIDKEIITAFSNSTCWIYNPKNGLRNNYIKLEVTNYETENYIEFMRFSHGNAGKITNDDIIKIIEYLDNNVEYIEHVWITWCYVNLEEFLSEYNRPEINLHLYLHSPKENISIVLEWDQDNRLIHEEIYQFISRFELSLEKAHYFC